MRQERIGLERSRESKAGRLERSTLGCLPRRWPLQNARRWFCSASVGGLCESRAPVTADDCSAVLVQRCRCV